MNEIKPIETHYKGYRFRSRLEARWAVFFDALGLRWDYEPEGFDLGKYGLYLPDFYIWDLDRFIEIKPYRNYDDWPDLDKAVGMAEIGHSLILLCGQPGTVEPYANNNSYNGFIAGDWSYYWCECSSCGALGIQFDGRSARNKHHENCNSVGGDKGYNLDSKKLLAAYDIARSARFEHGECG